MARRFIVRESKTGGLEVYDTQNRTVMGVYSNKSYTQAGSYADSLNERFKTEKLDTSEIISEKVYHFKRVERKPAGPALQKVKKN